MARSNSIRMPWYGGCLATGLVVCCATFSGCCNLAPVSDSFMDYDRPSWTEEIAPPDHSGEYFGASNRARQIERNVTR